MLGINHQSPLIYFQIARIQEGWAGNQSPIPFDILEAMLADSVGSWESITNPL